jgi:hypothetical protein
VRWFARQSASPCRFKKEKEERKNESEQSREQGKKKTSTVLKKVENQDGGEKHKK